MIVILETIEEMLSEGFQPQQTMLFSFGHYQEISGTNNAANISALIASKNIRLEYIIGEGGFIVDNYPLFEDQLMAMVALAEKNLCHPNTYRLRSGRSFIAATKR